MSELPFMKVKPPPPVVAAVAIFPDEVQFDCPVCDVTHMLTRTLDFNEDAVGVFRCKEQPGWECDCGALIVCDFAVNVLPPKSDP